MKAIADFDARYPGERDEIYRFWLEELTAGERLTSGGIEGSGVYPEGFWLAVRDILITFAE